MAKKRKVARKAKAKSRVDVSSIKRKRDEAEKLKLAHGVISGAYANLVEQFHPDGYDEEKIAKREGKRKVKKAKRKVARKAKAKKKVAPKRKVKTRRKK
jgi:hypothetical protein